MTDPRTAGEQLHVSERIVVSPSDGTFEPLPTKGPIQQNALIGYVYGPGTKEAVLSPFEGIFMGHIAHEGERLRAGEPIAWVRTE